MTFSFSLSVSPAYINASCAICILTVLCLMLFVVILFNVILCIVKSALAYLIVAKSKLITDITAIANHLKYNGFMSLLCKSTKETVAAVAV